MDEAKYAAEPIQQICELNTYSQGFLHVFLVGTHFWTPNETDEWETGRFTNVVVPGA